MTDIVERLRMDADSSNPYCLTVDDILDAADEIETLRQQIAGFPHLDDMRQAMIDTANENESLRQRVKELEDWSQAFLHMRCPRCNNEQTIKFERGTSAPTIPECWQPIETAPKGIDWVLLGYFPDYMDGKQQGGKPEIAYWNDAGYWVNSCGTALAVTGVFSPTHWMPLPAAPEPNMTLNDCN